MKTLSAELLAHYASDAPTLAVLWKVTRRDGQVFGFTSHDRKIPFDGVDYQPSSAFDASAVATTSDSAVDNLEAVGLLNGAGITAVDIEAGLWDGAAVELREVNWKDLSMGANLIRTGEIGQLRRKRGTYTAELRGLTQHLQNNIGYVLTPSCNASLGDARCGVSLTALQVTAAVATVTEAGRAFTCTGALTGAAGRYTFGVIEWLTGANAGKRMEVQVHTVTTGTPALALQVAMPYPIAPGDTFTATPGCDKSKATCKGTFSNLLNFRGFSFVPGQNRVLQIGGQ